MSADDEENGCVFLEKRKKIKYAPGELIRPLVLGEFISALMSAKMNNDTNTVQMVWLESKEPIDPSLVREAIHLLAKSNSVLQMCVVKCRGKLWFKRMMKLKVDFDTTTDGFMEVYDHLLRMPYDMKSGPLWRVRFISSNKKEKGTLYSSIVVYAVQHCITDGPTCMIYIRETVRLLNLLTRGESARPVVSGLSQTLPDTVKKKASLCFLLKTLFNELKETLINNFSHETTFNNALPRPVTKSPCTKLYLNDLTIEETKNLIAKCKSEKITVHTFISSCCSLALLKLAQGSSSEDIGERTIKFIHCIDGRRYIQDFDKTSSGCHLLLQFQKTKYSLNGDFWESAKQLQAELKRKVIEKEETVKLMPLSKFLATWYFLNYFLTSRSAPHRTTCHLMTTNMGNLKEHLPEQDENDLIDIKYIVRSVKNVYSGVPFMIGFQTFRNRFLISMDCYTSKMPEDIGKEYFNVLFSLIKQIVSKGSFE